MLNQVIDNLIKYSMVQQFLQTNIAWKRDLIGIVVQFNFNEQ